MASDDLPVAALELSGVTVRFGTFTANDAIDLTLRRGEIHALLGENGAGKSTLMSVVAGMLTPQHGRIRVHGQEVHLASPLDAAAHGIGMVHQHFMLIPTLTVAQNACLGLKRAGRLFPDMRRVAAEIRQISQRYGLAVDPEARVGDLSVAGQQRVEIVKALWRGAQILVLDEPTAVLAPAEVEGLFDVLRMLRENGTSIIFISHKLDEVAAISDRVSVLRRGRMVTTQDMAGTSPGALARLMIGGDLPLPETASPVPDDAPVALSVSGLSLRDETGVTRLSDVAFETRASEILGVAGVDGNGQHELAEVLVGLQAATTGRLTLTGQDITRASPGARIALGLSHVPEDRLRTALVDLPIADNAVLETVDRAPFARHGWLNHRAIADFATDLIRTYDVRCTGPDQVATTLSGGNQQKVVLGRALSRDPALVVAVQPTRGLDVGATAFVHSELLAQRARGAAVILVSTELDEIFALADRVIVMFGGRIAGTLTRSELTTDKLGALMTGRDRTETA